ncbi:DUF4276 family protein [Vitiosangium sp. GDMCC 1.1324]|uniref:DUF4276 family protein n=1 Tax=Vitiosangium sp. (strain GDMCC 1.1324) TaxID=2138576 RepID=UPI000D3A1CF1|nr:DUF4276 family protein [Vitiosangium sp. GDMCC 1.1324]PTL77005.1 hypothetical protein DAT35_45990 [Vitiosangium sp. GDMCC 1.1324]
MFRVVVYAEGPGELTGRDTSRQRAPGTPLTENELGSAHLLVRRCLERARSLAPELIQFEEPLRSRGKLARGSMLHSRTTLRPLLFWADEDLRPDLAIVLVDADGKEDRQAELDSTLQDLTVEAVASVAIQEFEAWLIADPQAVKAVIRKPLSPPKPPERLGRRQAKEFLQQWSDEHASKQDPAEIRRQLVQECDLDTLARVCPAFAEFLRRLGSARL